jgi:hypothetical protein
MRLGKWLLSLNLVGFTQLVSYGYFLSAGHIRGGFVTFRSLDKRNELMREKLL